MFWLPAFQRSLPSRLEGSICPWRCLRAAVTVPRWYWPMIRLTSLHWCPWSSETSSESKVNNCAQPQNYWRDLVVWHEQLDTCGPPVLQHRHTLLWPAEPFRYFMSTFLSELTTGSLGLLPSCVAFVFVPFSGGQINPCMTFVELTNRMDSHQSFWLSAWAANLSYCSLFSPSHANTVGQSVSSSSSSSSSCSFFSLSLSCVSFYSRPINTNLAIKSGYDCCSVAHRQMITNQPFMPWSHSL